MAYIKQEPVDDDGYGSGFGLDLVDLYKSPEPERLFGDFVMEPSPAPEQQYSFPPASPEPPQYRGSLSPSPVYESIETRKDHFGQLARPRARSPPARGGELSERSRQVRQAKRYGNYPDGIFGNVFETTGMIVGSTTCLRVTHMMIDTGASSIIISAAAAKQANLKVINCDPQTFFLANGSQITYNQLAHFELYISGIHNKVVAFIDQGNAGHHVLLGKPGIKAFNATANFSYGRKKETRWFVAQDETGLRRHKILLHEDPVNVASMMIPYGRYEGLRLAMPLGETATQRNSREVLERADKKRHKLYKKHEKNVLRRGDVRDFPDLFGRQPE